MGGIMERHREREREKRRKQESEKKKVDGRDPALAYNPR